MSIAPHPVLLDPILCIIVISWVPLVMVIWRRGLNVRQYCEGALCRGRCGVILDTERWFAPVFPPSVAQVQRDGIGEETEARAKEVSGLKERQN